MVRTFARLKLRLLRNSFRLGWQQKIGLVLGIIYAVPWRSAASSPWPRCEPSLTWPGP